MEIIAICGSPRGKRSQTMALARAVLDGAADQGAGVRLEDLSQARIGFCQACEKCHEGPDCVLHDDARRILDGMLSAEGIVLASPVYLSQVTAQMKALLDRTSHFIHCLRLTGKYVASVATYGGGGAERMHEFLRSYATIVGAQYVGSVDARVPLQDPDFAAARALGEDLVAAIRERLVYREQVEAIERSKAHFAKIIQARKDRWPFEYTYWHEKGWL